MQWGGGVDSRDSFNVSMLKTIPSSLMTMDHVLKSFMQYISVYNLLLYQFLFCGICAVEVHYLSIFSLDRLSPAK